jgi:transcriptional regulator with XRE-family HTH domain
LEHNLGKAIQAVRKSRKMTQKELGELIKVEESTISRYERGLLTPSLEALRAIVISLNTSADFLLGMSDCEQRKAAIPWALVMERLTELRDSLDELMDIVSLSAGEEQ